MAAVTTRQVGDTVTVGSTRWAIRSIDGEKVALEAMNVQPGITWNTTLDNLPDQLKEQDR